MTKKIALLFMLILNIVFVQNTSFAQGQYAKDLYLNNVQQKIVNNWIMPDNSTGKSTVVSIVIDQYGSVSDAEIVRSSNSAEFDKSAMDAVYKVSNYGQLLDGQQTLKLQFYFSPVFTSLNVIDDANKLLNPKNSNIVNVSNKNSNTNFVAYAEDLQTKITSNWTPKVLKHSKKALVAIDVTQNGAVKNISLVKSSKNACFDKQILDSIAKSIPTDVLPAGTSQDSAQVVLSFQYNSANKKAKTTDHHYVDAGVYTIPSYNQYTKQVEDIIAASLNGRRCLFNKDVVYEMSIDKLGQLKYVKVKTPSKDKNFDRTTLSILQKTSFPPIPSDLDLDTITLDYEVVTQRGYTWRDFFDHYLLHLGTTGVKSFVVKLQ